LDPALVPNFAVAIASPVSIPSWALGGERYPAAVRHNEGGTNILDRPGRREAATYLEPRLCALRQEGI
jgi:hypothetical protein